MSIDDTRIEGDPRVTAYIFGELSDEDTTLFEEELANSNELQRAVTATREALLALEAEFASETPLTVNEIQRCAVEDAIQVSDESSTHRSTGLSVSSLKLGFSSRSLIVWGSVAACLMIAGVLSFAARQSFLGTDSPKVVMTSELEKQKNAAASSPIVLFRDGDMNSDMINQSEFVVEPQLSESLLVNELSDPADGELVELDFVAPVNSLVLSDSANPVELRGGVTHRWVMPQSVDKQVFFSTLNRPLKGQHSVDVSHFDIDGDDIVDNRDFWRKNNASGDRHDLIVDNPFLRSVDSPLSTFSVDVDTASYAKVRMYLLQQNALPRPDAVRIEELLNYFTYDYEAPSEDSEHPFKASMQVAECPWNAKHRLARIGIKGREFRGERPASNLVFLLDVSGSMDQPNKLPLVIDGMKMLVDRLGENDSVAIVVYAGAAGLVLDSTSGDNKQTIIDALSRLKAGGSTNGGDGIQLAYNIARDHFIPGATNRVILCSDGDFNVGVTGNDELVRLVADNAKSNIFLSVLGFGMGNHNDSMMESISNQGNGNYAFIDTRSEARKVLVEQLGSTLITIAKDVKIQVEFNPLEVAAYRLIGYENRVLSAQDFSDDKKDAGEIGAGHTVTALYELVPANDSIVDELPAVDDLRYQKKGKASKLASTSDELLTLKLRYKQPEGTKSTLIEFPVKDKTLKIEATDSDFRFAAAVASFGMLLRDSPHKGNATYAAVEEIAGGATNDTHGYRVEFLRLVALAKSLAGE